MKNNKILMNVVLGILFVVFNVIVFQIPVIHTDSYWIVYGFTCVAFAMQFYVWNLTLTSNEEIKSKFLGYPITNVSVLYFFVQLLVCWYVMVNNNIEQWKVIIINVVVLGTASSCICFTQVGKNYIGDIDKKVAAKVEFIKDTMVELNLISNELKETDEKQAMEKLIEIVRYSDPMSSEKLAGLEKEIETKITELKNSNKSLEIINLLQKKFVERNARCQAFK